MDLKTKYNFQRICRICLEESCNVINLFGAPQRVSDIIMACSNIKILKNDGLPVHVCYSCAKEADNALNFKQKCEKSDAKLRSFVTNTPQFQSEINIKEEQCLIGLNDLTEYLKYEQSPSDSIFTSLKDTASNGYCNDDGSTSQCECHICKSAFECTKDLINHVLADHAHPIKIEENMMFCEICNRKYNSIFDLRKHQVTHKEFTVDGKKNVCPLCQESFLKHESFLRHMGYHVEDSNYECKTCRCFFTTNLQLRRHLNRIHNEKTAVDTGILIKSELNLIEDSISLDSNNYGLDNELDLGSEDLMADIADPNLSTNYIGHNLTTDLDVSDFETNKILSEIIGKSERKKHKILVGKLSSRKESENGDLKKKSKRKSKKLKLNGEVRKSEGYFCEECPKKFSRIEALEDHKKQHRGERSYLCSVCGKGYFKQSHLDKHMSTHNERMKKPAHVCPLCGKVVAHSNHLQAHMRTHKSKTGEPLISQPVNPNKNIHLCSACGKSCSSRSNLAVHMRRHTGTMTCVCKICGKGYPRTTDLTLHMRYHTGERPFVCKVCNRGFARSDKLAIHMRTHTGEKPYVCPKCGRAFAQCNDLSSHKKRNNCNGNLIVQSNSGILTLLDNVTTADTAEDHLLLLAQNKELQVTTVESSTFSKVGSTNNMSIPNSYKGKRKKNTIQQKAVNLATNSVTINDKEEQASSHAAKAFELAAVAATNNLFGVTANNTTTKIENTDPEEAQNVAELIKQNFIVSDIVATRRALELASVSHNSLLSTHQQRTEYSDYTTAALIQIQSAHFGMR